MLTLLFVLVTASGHADDRVATPEAEERSTPVTQTLRHLEAEIVLSAWRKDPGIKSPLIWRSATQDARGDSAPLCQQTADYDVKENMAFETAGNATAARVPIFRMTDQAPAREGTWSDFDAVMWLRCPKENADTCNPATVLPAPKVTDRLETMIQDVSRRRSKAR